MGRSSHRVPPRPASYRSAKPGTCKFCAEPIVMGGKINRRANWHPACALRWTIMNSPRDARRFVFVRDRGVCCDCGTNCAPNGGNPDTVARIVEKIMSPPANQQLKLSAETLDLGDWELDHHIPLSEAARLGNPPELWQLGNMRTRCHKCHVLKTREDRLRYGASDDQA